MKFNYHESVSNVSSATLFGLDIGLDIDKISEKLSQRIALLRKIRVYLPLKQRLLYYNSIIHPTITYASVMWSSCDNETLNRVFRLRKRAARVILSADGDSPSVQLF